MLWAPLLLLVISSVLGAQTKKEASNPQAPERWRSFLWMYQGPDVGEDLFQSLRRLGVSGTNVNGTTPSSVHGRLGFPFYVDHAAGKGDLAIRDDAFLRSKESFLQNADAPGMIRPSCLLDPSTLARMKKRIGEVVGQAAPNGPAAYALDDEISLTHRNEPFDYCFCELCRADYETFLARRYGSIEKALVAQGRSKETPAAKLLESTQEIRRREFIKDPGEWNFASWSDRLDHMDGIFEDTIASLVSDVRALDPKVPVGFTGGEAPHPFSGVDWPRLLPHVRFVEPYDVGGSRELVRSFATPDTTIFKTIFAPTDGDPLVNVHELWDYFLRGDHGAILWSAKEFFDERRIEQPSMWARTISGTMSELSSDRMCEWLRARPKGAEIALVESQASNRMHWMIDSRTDGRTWVKRGGSWEARHSSQNRTREAWQKLLEDIHMDYVHITPEMLESEDLSRFKVIILPRTIALSRSRAEKLIAFAKKGTVIADCQTGLFDERLRARSEGVLDEFFGVRRLNRLVHLSESQYTGPKDFRNFSFAVAEPGIEPRKNVATMLRVAEIPAIFDRPFETGGRAVYLNVLLVDYLDQRLVNRDEHALQRELRGILRSAGVKAPCEIRYPGSESIPVRAFMRQRENVGYLGLIANWQTSTNDVPSAELLARRQVNIEVLLPKSAIVTDLRTGIVAGTNPRGLTRTSSFVVTLPMTEALVYRLEF